MRLLGPVSFVLLALASACGSGSTSLVSLKGLSDAGLGGNGYDATVTAPAGDDAAAGSSSGSSPGDDSTAAAPGDDGSQPADAGGANDGSPGSTPADAGGASSSGSSGGSSSGTSGSGGGSSTGGGLMCVSVCHTNVDCQSSCPPVLGGSNCCDESSTTCFASQAPCPNPGDASPE